MKGLGIDCRMVLKLVLKNRGWVWTRLIDWGRDKWWTLVSIVMNLQFSYSVGNFLTKRRTLGFSRRIVLHGVSRVF